MRKEKRKLTEAEKRDLEMRRWGKRDPAARPGIPHVWIPADTIMNEGNNPMKAPETEYDDVGGGLQDGLRDGK